MTPPPIATVATGTPRGICTIDSSASRPLRLVVETGTPMTGSGVLAASMPGRCAAPPAPAISTFRPRAHGGAGVVGHGVGGAVGGEHAQLVGDAEALEDLGGGLQRGQV